MRIIASLVIIAQTPSTRLLDTSTTVQDSVWLSETISLFWSWQEATQQVFPISGTPGQVCLQGPRGLMSEPHSKIWSIRDVSHAIELRKCFLVFQTQLYRRTLINLCIKRDIWTTYFVLGMWYHRRKNMSRCELEIPPDRFLIWCPMRKYKTHIFCCDLNASILT